MLIASMVLSVGLFAQAGEVPASVSSNPCDNKWGNDSADRFRRAHRKYDLSSRFFSLVFDSGSRGACTCLDDHSSEAVN